MCPLKILSFTIDFLKEYNMLPDLCAIIGEMEDDALWIIYITINHR